MAIIKAPGPKIKSQVTFHFLFKGKKLISILLLFMRKFSEFFMGLDMLSISNQKSKRNLLKM